MCLGVLGGGVGEGVVFCRATHGYQVASAVWDDGSKNKICLL